MRKSRNVVVACAAVVVSLACVAGQEATSHSTHDHDESSHTSHEDDVEGNHFEAAAVYDVGVGTNSFIAFPPEGSFEEETFAFMIVPAASADLEGLEDAEEGAEAAWDAYTSGAEEPTILTSGVAVTPSADVVYQIALEDPLVLVPVNITIAGAHAVFLEHGSDEVGTALVSPDGDVLVAAAEEGTEEEEEEEEEDEDEEDEDNESASASQWANGIAASLVVSACSFTGIIVVINKRVAHSINLSHAFMFASGALLTASLLHIIPEALEGLEDEYDSLHDLGLYAGLAILGGISFGILIHALMDSGHSHSPNEPHHHPVGGNGNVTSESLGGDAHSVIKAPADGTSVGVTPVTGTTRMGSHGDVATQPSFPAVSDTANLQALMAARKDRSLLDLKGLQPVCWNVIAGDLVHNFADGVTIGAAFLSCSTTMGWTVTASAVLHEVPHELADFMALLNGGMSVKQAFAYNFLSALTAVLGTIIILALSDTLNDAQISIILLVGAGSFIFIALSELLPDAVNVASDTKSGGSVPLCSQLRKLASFLLGALLIGVPLIFDEHCSAGHDGHDH
ncbi:unnamed protein product [Scytosiphon promiscuus]